MTKLLYCWRCKMEIPMLDDQEWQRLRVHLDNAVTKIKEYQETHAVTLARAHSEASAAMLSLYREMTGFEETNKNALWHHRISLYGSPCHVCGRPLRTPVAKRCVECGAVRSGNAPTSTL
jgi:hypothetical protein